eukprot:11904864-Karenia_brevis.AAC.1
MVNPQIMVRDQISYPAVGEKTVTLVRAERKRPTMIDLKADVARGSPQSEGGLAGPTLAPLRSS